MITLIALSGDTTFELEAGKTLVVGRTAAADISVIDPTISRQHAEVTVTDKGLRIRDLGSSNGTFVNGESIKQKEAVAGDVVAFGRVAFRLERRSVAPPPPIAQDSAREVNPTILKELSVLAVPGVSPLGLDRTAAPASGAIREKELVETERREKTLGLLLEVSKALSRPAELDQLLAKIVDFTFQIMEVDRVSIQLLDEATGELVPRLSRSRAGNQEAPRSVPRSIARRAVGEKVAILSNDAASDNRFMGDSILMQSVRSAMCTPMLGSDEKVIGILYVDNRTAVQNYGDEDLSLLAAFGGLAAVAIENARMGDRLRREALKLSNFQRYFAPDVAAQIAEHEGEVQLRGDKRPVVVFFSDIRGFTSMSEKMTPDEVASLLTEYFTEMVDIVFEHGGTLDKFIGDAIMAQWGAPIAREDDADRAMRCALDQQAALERMNEKWLAEGGPAVRIGIGINQGEAFAGNIGSNRRLEYTLIGDTVNTASRLCSNAGPGEIVISDSFFRLLRKPPSVEALEPITVKGKAQPLPVYRIRR